MFQNGELLALSPGGVREALFSDEYYKLVWNGRLGFAKVAQEAQVVRIPSSPLLKYKLDGTWTPPAPSLAPQVSCCSSVEYPFI